MIQPTLIALYGDDDYDPEMIAIWPWVAKAAATAARIGGKLVKRVAKKVKAKRRKKSAAAAARRAVAAGVSVPVKTKKSSVVSVTENELRAAGAEMRRSGVSPALLIGGAAVAALLLMRRRG